ATHSCCRWRSPEGEADLQVVVVDHEPDGSLPRFDVNLGLLTSTRRAVPRNLSTFVPQPQREDGRMPRAVATQLMFEGNADAAMTLYVSLFKGSAVTRVERYGPGGPGAEGSVKRAEFTLAGHRMACIDSPIKHGFTFTPSASLFVDCEDEAEFDRAFG